MKLFCLIMMLPLILAACGTPYRPTSEIPRERWPKLESTHATYIKKVDGQYIEGYVFGVSGIAGGNTVQITPGEHTIELKVSSGTEDRVYMLPLNLEADTEYEVHQKDWATFQVVIVNHTHKRTWIFHPQTGAYYAVGAQNDPVLGALTP